ncbi:hypothetical protein A6X20_11870 [Bradyrhizobium elkanii]|nr:hypothetical protein A6452_40160 [Bradyrhizobium elkanii]ODM85623.1 hypothetical protein A6X20_11870 [Bradyrhizobium elkanii]
MREDLWAKLYDSARQRTPRAAIQRSKARPRSHSEDLTKQRKGGFVHDAPMGYKTVRSIAEEAIVVAFRKL